MRLHMRLLRGLGRAVGIEAERVGEHGILLRTRGFDWSTERKYLEQLDADETVRELLASLQIDLVIDVGANAGQFAQRLRSLGFRGTIVSFEPNPNEFEALQRRTRLDQNWVVLPYTLGESPGSATLNITRSSDFASVLHTNPIVDDFRSEREVVGTVVVKVVRLDDVWAEQITKRGATSVFLKVDTQGYDHQVFRGASRSLKDIRALMFEIPFVPLYEGVTPYAETLTLLGQYNLAPVGIWPVTRVKNSLAILEADVIMINGQSTT